MERNTLSSLLFLLLLVSVISCSGSSGSRKVPASDSADVTVTALPAKRLVEVLAPADNAALSCSERIVFSVARATGSARVDSVQLWVGGKRYRTITVLPATVEIDPPENQAGLPSGQ